VGGNGFFLLDCERLLLGWCAQLLASQSAHSSSPAYPADFLDAARSIYSFALAPELARPRMAGRGQPDLQLMLAYASFPFLEGFARRRLSAYLNQDGVVLSAFAVSNRTYRVGTTISNLSHTLELLESDAQSSGLGPRLAQLRSHVQQTSTADDRGPSPRAVDLYQFIFEHRNANLHGGRQVSSVGLMALFLATIVALEATRSDFDELCGIARMVVGTQAPLDPAGPWPHWVFYPVLVPDAPDPSLVHRWPIQGPGTRASP